MERKRIFKRSDEPLRLTGRSVYVRDGQDPLKAFKKLTKKLKEDGFFERMRELEFFQKPSNIKKTKLGRAKSREKKRLLKLAEDGPGAYTSSRSSKNRGKKTKRGELFNAKIRRRSAKKG